MGLFCSICKNVVPEGFGQCLACKAGFAPQLACEVCRRLVPRGAVACDACARSARGAALVPTSPVSSPLQSLPGLPALVGISAPALAPPALPGLPAHVGLSQVQEVVNAGRFGVEATVHIPPGDVAIMNDMCKVVVIAHTVASRISASLAQAVARADLVSDTAMSTTVSPSSSPTVGEIMSEMGQLIVVLHRLAEQINHFQGHAESTRAIIRSCRLLATDLQGEIEAWKMTNTWRPTEANRALVRQCRVVATELQDEIETRRGPRG